MPGGGTPMHYHRRFAETFIVVGQCDNIKNKTIKVAGRAGVYREKRSTSF